MTKKDSITEETLKEISSVKVEERVSVEKAVMKMFIRKRKLTIKPIIKHADVFRPVTSLGTTLPEVTETTTAKTVESPEEDRRVFNLWYEDQNQVRSR